MPGSIYDIDLDATPPHGCILGEDGNSSFALQRVGVHHPLDQNLVLTESARLAEHLVHQCRFAVIDVRDDGDVSDVHSQ